MRKLRWVRFIYVENVFQDSDLESTPKGTTTGVAGEFLSNGSIPAKNIRKIYEDLEIVMTIDIDHLENKDWHQKMVDGSKTVIVKQFGNEQVSIIIDYRADSEIDIAVETGSQFSGLAKKDLGSFSNENEVEKFIHSECEEVEIYYSQPRKKFRPTRMSNEWSQSD